MKFHITKTGDLILIKTNAPTSPRRPIVAQSVKPAAPWLIRFILWLATCAAPFIPHWPPAAWTNNKGRLAVLAIVVMVLVEVLAQNHVERALGVMA